MTDTPWPPEGTRVRIVREGMFFEATGEIVFCERRGWGVSLDNHPAIVGNVKRHEIEVIDGDR